MILEFPEFIDLETVEHIRNSVKPYLSDKKAPSYNRDGNTISVSTMPELKELDEKLHAIFNSAYKNIIVNRFKPIFPATSDTGYEYHRYGLGDICQYHADGEVAEGRLRFATAIIHLSTIENGGETIFPSQNVKIKSEAGKLVVFPPYGMYGHYTTPADEPREILMTWFIYENVNVVC